MQVNNQSVMVKKLILYDWTLARLTWSVNIWTLKKKNTGTCEHINDYLLRQKTFIEMISYGCKTKCSTARCSWYRMKQAYIVQCSCYKDGVQFQTSHYGTWTVASIANNVKWVFVYIGHYILSHYAELKYSIRTVTLQYSNLFITYITFVNSLELILWRWETRRLTRLHTSCLSGYNACHILIYGQVVRQIGSERIGTDRISCGSVVCETAHFDRTKCTITTYGDGVSIIYVAVNGEFLSLNWQ